MKSKRTVSKHDIVRNMKDLFYQNQMLSSKIADVSLLFTEYLSYMKHEKKFEKYLDGKYKQEEPDGSGTIPTPSK